ncbi:MAG: LapA family protein [Spirochaetes bacterium]|nr:LapA family protein [Spirochaetota bacterium]
MGRKISNIVLIVLVATVTIVSMTNLQPVTFKVLFFSFQIPLIILFYFPLITGFIAGYVTKGIVTYRKNKRLNASKDADMPEKKKSRKEKNKIKP